MTQTFVYQKWDQIFATVNFVFSRDGPFGLGGGVRGRGVWGSPPPFGGYLSERRPGRHALGQDYRRLSSHTRPLLAPNERTDPVRTPAVPRTRASLGPGTTAPATRRIPLTPIAVQSVTHAGVSRRSGASKGQVWPRHSAPAAPAFTRPSSPSQSIVRWGRSAIAQSPRAPAFHRHPRMSQPGTE